MWRSPSAFFRSVDYHNERWQELKGISEGAPAAREVSRRFENANDGRNHLFAKTPQDEFSLLPSRRISDFTETILERLGNFLKFTANGICGQSAVLGNWAAA